MPESLTAHAAYEDCPARAAAGRRSASGAKRRTSGLHVEPGQMTHTSHLLQTCLMARKPILPLPMSLCLAPAAAGGEAQTAQGGGQGEAPAARGSGPHQGGRGAEGARGRAGRHRRPARLRAHPRAQAARHALAQVCLLEIRKTPSITQGDHCRACQAKWLTFHCTLLLLGPVNARVAEHCMTRRPLSAPGLSGCCTRI